MTDGPPIDFTQRITGLMVWQALDLLGMNASAFGRVCGIGGGTIRKAINKPGEEIRIVATIRAIAIGAHSLGVLFEDGQAILVRDPPPSRMSKRMAFLAEAAGKMDEKKATLADILTRHDDGEAHASIARTHGLTESIIRSRIYRARGTIARRKPPHTETEAVQRLAPPSFNRPSTTPF